MSNVLTLRCPRCQWEHADEFECLDSGQPDMLRCENPQCSSPFAHLVRECLECGEESVFTWKSMPPQETLALLSCNFCGAPFDETASQDEGKDPSQRV